ncbi:cuticle protein 7-like [Eriocheir sinensis]|uniref:cuticle protein 7-like n=1 Tax=Eriocheir sinensis TaxID=95602 RepID=UPI0021C8A1E8|nr:cuticle protein 7-like [Eriocheir sinensis]
MAVLVKVWCLAAVVAMVSAALIPHIPATVGETRVIKGQDNPNYEFQYGVSDRDTGNDFGQRETRLGEDTRGSYRVLLPDGRLQTVTYTVSGDSGFVAEVTYSRPS